MLTPLPVQTLPPAVTPTYIYNELLFSGRPPNQYQVSIENTNLTVEARVTYSSLPEPATMGMLAAVTGR